MASNRPARVKAGTQIVAEVDHLEDLLHEFALVDKDGFPLKGVRMLGVCNKNTKTHSSCFLHAANEAFAIPISKVSSVANSISAPKYYVVVDKKVVEVNGLLLPEGIHVEGYHLCRADAEKELEPEPPKTTAATAAVATPNSSQPRADFRSCPTAVTTPKPNATTPVANSRARRRVMTTAEEKMTESKVPEEESASANSEISDEAPPSEASAEV